MLHPHGQDVGPRWMGESLIVIMESDGIQTALGPCPLCARHRTGEKKGETRREREGEREREQKERKKERKEAEPARAEDVNKHATRPFDNNGIRTVLDVAAGVNSR